MTVDKSVQSDKPQGASIHRLKHSKVKLRVLANAENVQGMDVHVHEDTEPDILTVLFNDNKLGGHRESQRRYEIGQWLYGCWYGSGQPQQDTASYDGLPSNPNAFHELTPSQGWNFQVYHDACKAMKAYCNSVVDVVIWNQTPNEMGRAFLKAGLDILERHRNG